MDQRNNQSFGDWIDDQASAGLRDIKLAVGVSRGASVRLVQEDIMDLDLAAKTGYTSTLPTPDSFLPDSISEKFDEIRLD